MIRASGLPWSRFAGIWSLAIGILAGLSAIHLGLEKIGVVLAALGVGLGFGLQEIVSNFVSGIILLLERPIRGGRCRDRRQHDGQGGSDQYPCDHHHQWR